MLRKQKVLRSQLWVNFSFFYKIGSKFGHYGNSANYHVTCDVTLDYFGARLRFAENFGKKI